MKKMTAAAVLFLLFFLFGCSNMDKAGETPTAGVSAGAASAPAEAYGGYSTVKNKALDDIMHNAEQQGEELHTFIYDRITPLTEANVILMPLTAIGSGEEALGVFEQFGMKDIMISQEEDGIRITGNWEHNPFGREGPFELKCVYDAAADSMQVTASGSAGEVLHFEYVRAGNGYASQFYFKDTSNCITMFCDGDTEALGAWTAQDRPALQPDKGADIVKNGEMYCIISGGKMTVYDNGEEKTY